MCSFFSKIQLTAGCIAVLIILLSVTGIAETVTIEHDNIIYRANYQIPDGNNETNATFLITHGTLAHNEMEIIVQMSNLLQEYGYNTLAINLSYGISNRPGSFYDCKVPTRHLHEDAVQEIAMWVNWLKKKNPVKIIPVGHSRGGNQTAMYLQTAPEMISHAVLFAPSTWNYKKTKSAYKEHSNNDIEGLLKKADMMKKNGKGSELLKNVSVLYCDNSDVSANALFSYYQDDPRKNTPQTIAQSNRSILVFAGAKDKIVEDLPAMMEKYVGNKPNIQFEIIDTADHFFRDLNMDDAVDIILEFIEE